MNDSMSHNDSMHNESMNDSMHNDSMGNMTEEDRKQQEDLKEACDMTIEVFLRGFPGLHREQFIICDHNNTDDRCIKHPLRLPLNNQTKGDQVFKEFQRKSRWGFIPVIVPLLINGGARALQEVKRNESNSTGLSMNFSNFTNNNANSSAPNLMLHFIFIDVKTNIDLVKFLLSSNISLEAKLGKVLEIQKTIQGEMQQFVQFFNASEKLGEDKKMLDKDEMRNQFNDSNILKCVFETLTSLFKQASKSIYKDDCDFNLSMRNTTNSNNSNNSSNSSNSNNSLCNKSFGLDFQKELRNCSDKAHQIQNISGLCGNNSCVICLGPDCFTQSFKYEKNEESNALKYNKDQGREQFKKDERVSLKTGKRIPDFVTLPDTSFLTSFNFTPPCTDLQNCSEWFCSKFLRGPVAKLEKIYNPQDANDDLDESSKALYANHNDSKKNSTNSSGSQHRLLQDTTDATISETAGINFNTIASLSGLDSTVVIDGISTVAEVFNTSLISTILNTTNATNGTTTNNNGNYGSRGLFNALAFVLVLVMSLVAY